MYMKFIIAAMMASSVIVVFKSHAMSSNSIEFIGEVADQTFGVSVNVNNANPTIVLSGVSEADLASSGETHSL